MRLVSVCAAFVIVLPASLAAQEPVDTKFYLGGGLELGHFAGFTAGNSLYGPAVGLSLQGGYTRQYGRFGLRLGLGYFERQRDYGPAAFGTSTELYHVSTSRTAAANIDVTYDLTSSRFRPYLIGGIAPYWTSQSQRYNSGQTAAFKEFGVAFSPGLGIRVPIRGVEIFTEARLYLFSGHSHVFSPLTVGIRF